MHRIRLLVSDFFRFISSFKVDLRLQINCILIYDDYQ